MSLHGNLSTMDIEEVLGWLRDTRKSGWLYVSRDDIERSFVVSAAQITSSSSNIDDEQLGSLLVDQGVVDEAALEQAFEVQVETGVLLGKILLMIGALDASTLRSLLEEKIVDAMSEVISWRTGTFLFEPSSPDHRSEFSVELAINDCLERAHTTAARRRRMSALIPSMETRFWLVPGEGHTAEQGVSEEMVAAITAGASVREIARTLRSPRLQTAEELFALVETGVIAVERRSRSRRDTDSPPSLEELETAAWGRILGGDLVGALDLAEMAMSMYRADERAVELAESLRVRVVARATSELLSRGRVPVLTVAPSKLESVATSADERAAAASIDGVFDLWSLVERSPLGYDRAVVAFYRLFKRELVS